MDDMHREQIAATLRTALDQDTAPIREAIDRIRPQLVSLSPESCTP